MQELRVSAACGSCRVEESSVGELRCGMLLALLHMAVAVYGGCRVGVVAVWGCYSVGSCKGGVAVWETCGVVDWRCGGLAVRGNCSVGELWLVGGHGCYQTLCIAYSAFSGETSSFQIFTKSFASAYTEIAH